MSKDPRSQEWYSVDLNLAFKIPMYHRSIITPNGEIFLIGGMDVISKNKALSHTY